GPPLLRLAPPLELRGPPGTVAEAVSNVTLRAFDRAEATVKPDDPERHPVHQDDGLQRPVGVPGRAKEGRPPEARTAELRLRPGGEQHAAQDDHLVPVLRVLGQLRQEPPGLLLADRLELHSGLDVRVRLVAAAPED